MKPRAAIPGRFPFRKHRTKEISDPAQYSHRGGLACGESVESVGKAYFQRKLRILDDSSEREILDSDLLGQNRSVVVLGEPGMGKQSSSPSLVELLVWIQCQLQGSC